MKYGARVKNHHFDGFLFDKPQYTAAKEIKEVRNKLGLTQKEFAMLINSSKATVERWEISKEQITGPICLLLKMLEKYPEYVDEMNRTVHIKNYTDNLMFRAFGVEEHPDFKAYTEFLESRCFPESRDKMKLILRDLDLPFYDPFMIIEKTEGRMAEDDFWIRIER